MKLKIMLLTLIAVAGLSSATYGQVVRGESGSVNNALAAPQGGGLVDAIERGIEAQRKAFTGSWEGVFTPEDGGPPPFRILFTFGTDGTVVASDAGPPTPQNNTAEHGAWERTGDREFTIIYKQFLFNALGELDGTFKGRVRFKLDELRREISGLVKVNIYDPTGQEIIAGAGTIKCTKIQVEPLD
jgi:hypothetical protein